jgi:hypothetical protein
MGVIEHEDMMKPVDVVYEGPREFVATERVPQPLSLRISIRQELPVGTTVSVLLGRFRSLLDNNPDKFKQWSLSGIELQGPGKIKLEQEPPTSFSEMGSRRTNHGEFDNHFRIVCATVTEKLEAGSWMVVNLKGMLTHQAPIQAQLVVSLDLCGTGHSSDPVVLKGVPGPPAGLVARAKRVPDQEGVFDLNVHTVDAFWNPVEPSLPLEDLEVDVSGDAELKGGRLVVTGSAAVRVRLRHRKLGLEAVTNPVRRTDLNGCRVHFGEFHFHSLFSGDGDRSIQEAYTYARDVLLLDFAGVTDHSPTRFWDQTQDLNQAFLDEPYFVTLPAWEWSTNSGHSNIYLRTPEVKASPQMDQTADHPGKADWPEDAIVIPHHTNIRSKMRKPDGSHYWHAFDWSLPNKRVRLVELIQTRGNFEADELDDDWGIVTCGIGASVHDALAMGYRIGFVGGTDNHTGFPTRDSVQGKGFCGMACILAEENIREALWQAMDARRTYATSGVPILAHWTLNDYEMGEEGQWSGELNFTAELNGTAPIERVELIADGKIIWRDHPDALDVTYREPLPTDAMEAGSYCYLRLRQQDGHRAWLSPIWLDES